MSYKIKYHRRNFGSILSMLLIFILGITSFFPPIRVLPFFNYIWLIVMLSWVMIIFITKPSFFNHFTLHRTLTYLFIFYTISIALLSGNSFIGNRFIEYSQILIFYWAYQINKGKNNDNLIVILLLFPFILYTGIITLINLNSSSLAVRIVKKSSESGLESMLEGIGGYDFIYSLVFLVIVLFYIKVRKNLKYKVLLIGTIFLFLLIIVLSNFMIALLLTVTGLLFRVLIPNLDYKRAGLYAIIVGALIPFLMNLFILIIDSLVNGFFENTMNASRLLELKSLLEGGLIESSLGARIDAYLLSINTFFENPVFGIIFDQIKQTSEGIFGFGQHSFFLDTFALYGFLIGILQLYIFLQPLYIRTNINIYSSNSLSFVILLVATIFLTLNNIAPSIGFVLFFMYPVIHDWIISSRQQDYDMNTHVQKGIR